MPTPIDVKRPTPAGPGLALSGGGLRAMLFHLGVVERLYLSRQLDTFRELTSVSGGSILAGLLALRWPELKASQNREVDFEALIARPTLEIARLDLRNRAFAKAVFGRTPIASIAELLDEHLFKDAKLRHLPDLAELRVTFNSCNLANGRRFVFNRQYAGDRVAGYTVDCADIPIAVAVAASAAFPVGFAPYRVSFRGPFYNWIHDDELFHQISSDDKRDVDLGDGGIFENLGLHALTETSQTAFISNAGSVLDRQVHPPGNAVELAIRALSIMMSRHARDLLDPAYEDPDHYTIVEISHEVPGGFARAEVDTLGALRTELDAFSDEECTALRWHGASVAQMKVAPDGPPPPLLPKKPELDWAKLARGKSTRLVPGFFEFWKA